MNYKIGLSGVFFFFSFQLKIIEVLVFFLQTFIDLAKHWLSGDFRLSSEKKLSVGCTRHLFVLHSIGCLVFFWVSADSFVFPQNFFVFGLKLVVWCFLVPLGKAVGVKVDSDLIIALANA